MSTVEGWQGKVVTIPAEAFNLAFMEKYSNPLRLIGAFFCASDFEKDRPDGFGDGELYKLFAPVTSAICLQIPYVLHEANVVPGRLVSMMSSRATAIAISFEASRYYLTHMFN